MDKFEMMYEKVWATLDRVGERLDRMSEEADKSRAEAEERSRKLDEELAKREADRKRSEAVFNRRMRKLDELIGGVGNSNGAFAEEYFFNSFEKGKTDFFGECFDEIEKNMEGDETDDEFDVVMINGQSVGIVEVKYKGKVKNVPKILQKADAFRLNFPEYANHRIFLGMASMSFTPDVEQACTENGIAIIKQVGDKVIINDKHIKAF